MSNLAKDLLQTLYKVWTSYSKRLPKCQALSNKILELNEILVEKEAIEKLLSDANSAKLCPECGERFPLATKKDRQKYKIHQEKHARENFTCDCGIDFQDSNEKRR